MFIFLNLLFFSNSLIKLSDALSLPVLTTKRLMSTDFEIIKDPLPIQQVEYQ